MTTENWLTYELIATTADELWRLKKPVSVQTLRERLGRGSKTTLHKHLLRW